jgi:hypothetical protein
MFGNLQLRRFLHTSPDSTEAQSDASSSLLMDLSSLQSGMTATTLWPFTTGPLESSLAPAEQALQKSMVPHGGLKTSSWQLTQGGFNTSKFKAKTSHQEKELWPILVLRSILERICAVLLPSMVKNAWVVLNKEQSYNGTFQTWHIQTRNQATKTSSLSKSSLLRSMRLQFNSWSTSIVRVDLPQEVAMAKSSFGHAKRKTRNNR